MDRKTTFRKSLVDSGLDAYYLRMLGSNATTANYISSDRKAWIVDLDSTGAIKPETVRLYGDGSCGKVDFTKVKKYNWGTR